MAPETGDFLPHLRPQGPSAAHQAGQDKRAGNRRLRSGKKALVCTRIHLIQGGRSAAGWMTTPRHITWPHDGQRTSVWRGTASHPTALDACYVASW